MPTSALQNNGSMRKHIFFIKRGWLYMFHQRVQLHETCHSVTNGFAGSRPSFKSFIEKSTIP